MGVKVVSPACDTVTGDEGQEGELEGDAVMIEFVPDLEAAAAAAVEWD